MKEKSRILEMLQAEAQRKGLKVSEDEMNESAEIATLIGALCGSHVVSVEMKKMDSPKADIAKCYEPKPKSVLKIKKKRNNLIEIDYTEDAGCVTILAIRNMLTQDQVYRKYGEEVFNRYGSEQERIEFDPIVQNFYCRYRKDLTVYMSSLPHDMPKSKFSELVAYYRKAGENLCRIVKEVRTKQEKCKTTIGVDMAQGADKTVHTIVI